MNEGKERQVLAQKRKIQEEINVLNQKILKINNEIAQLREKKSQYEALRSQKIIEKQSLMDLKYLDGKYKNIIN